MDGWMDEYQLNSDGDKFVYNVCVVWQLSSEIVYGYESKVIMDWYDSVEYLQRNSNTRDNTLYSHMHIHVHVAAMFSRMAGAVLEF